MSRVVQRLTRWPLLFVTVVFAFYPAFCQTPYFDPLAGIKKAVRSPNHSSHDVATEVIRMFGDVNSEPLNSARNLLAKEHDDWQTHSKPPLDEGKLATSLNHHLNLNNSAEYIKLHATELRRIRVFLWTQVPDLNGDFRSRNLSRGGSVVTTQVPPLEAFLSVGMLIYQKMFNPEYLQTDDERSADTFGLIAARTAASQQPVGSNATSTVPPALQARQQEFQGKARDFVLKSWSTGSTLEDITNILSESR